MILILYLLVALASPLLFIALLIGALRARAPTSAVCDRHGYDPGPDLDDCCPQLSSDLLAPGVARVNDFRSASFSSCGPSTCINFSIGLPMLSGDESGIDPGGSTFGLGSPGEAFGDVDTTMESPFDSHDPVSGGWTGDFH